MLTNLTYLFFNEFSRFDKIWLKDHCLFTYLLAESRLHKVSLQVLGRLGLMPYT